jgi:hypothetical protein
MSSPELENLVRAGSLNKQPANQEEFDGLMDSGRKRLADATHSGLSAESRFDLAYGAAHAFARAALRWHGYRTEKRYLVFQALPHTLGLKPEIWRVLDKAHHVRNQAEYQGYFEVDEKLLGGLLKAADRVCKAAEKLGPVRAANKK